MKLRKLDDKALHSPRRRTRKRASRRMVEWFREKGWAGKAAEFFTGIGLSAGQERALRSATPAGRSGSAR